MDKLPYEYQEFWKRWNDIEGQSDVREFWIPVLVNFIISILLSIIGFIIGTDFLGGLFGLAIIIPNITVMIRRFHDTGRSGWYWLWNLLPLIGWIIVIIALIQPTKED